MKTAQHKAAPSAGLKTLIKLAKGRTSIPILNTLAVRAGRITATDMGIYIPVNDNESQREVRR